MKYSFRLRPVVALIVALTTIGAAEHKPEVIVGAAANLTMVFQELGAKFEAETGIHPVFSFASSAQLAQQIQNGAPFDVFASAQTADVDHLAKQGKLDRASVAIYARGVLALWIPPTSSLKVKTLEELAASDAKVIAVAKPELAPYGAASVAALQRAGVWDRIKDRIVYAGNIAMARQYGQSGNADAVLTAYSLVMRDRGKVIRLDPASYAPIDQELGILTEASNVAEARRIVDYLLRGNGRSILAKFGYQPLGGL